MIRSAWQEASALPRNSKTLRSFGLLVGGVLATIALYLTWSSGWMPGILPLVIGGVGALLLVLGTFAPLALGPAYPIWMAAALVLGTIMTTVLLTLVFYLIVTPIGLIMRIAGKDPMHRRPDPSMTTYWIDRAPESNDVGRMEKYY